MLQITLNIFALRFQSTSRHHFPKLKKQNIEFGSWTNLCLFDNEKTQRKFLMKRNVVFYMSSLLHAVRQQNILYTNTNWTKLVEWPQENDFKQKKIKIDVIIHVYGKRSLGVVSGHKGQEWLLSGLQFCGKYSDPKSKAFACICPRILRLRMHA